MCRLVITECGLNTAKDVKRTCAEKSVRGLSVRLLLLLLTSQLWLRNIRQSWFVAPWSYLYEMIC